MIKYLSSCMLWPFTSLPKRKNQYDVKELRTVINKVILFRQLPTCPLLYCQATGYMKMIKYVFTKHSNKETTKLQHSTRGNSNFWKIFKKISMQEIQTRNDHCTFDSWQMTILMYSETNTQYTTWTQQHI